MLIKKVYNEETKTEKAWFDSSMFFHTVMIEDPAENKGDLYVTFKNGATYLYKDVAFEDYVLLIGGGTDMSQGKSLNKYIKSKYEFERVGDKSIQALQEELDMLEAKEDEKWITYFISGHRNITEEEFERNYKSVIEHVISEMPNCKFIVGDYYGVDIMAQNYLMDVLNLEPERLTVYHMFDKPRNVNEKVTQTIGGFTSDEERDAAMTAASFDDIAFVRDHTKISGTAQNILRRKRLM